MRKFSRWRPPSQRDTRMTPLWVAQLSLDTSMETNDSMEKSAQIREQIEEVPALLTVAQNLDLYYLPVLLSVGLSLHVILCVGFTKTKLYHKFFTQLFLAVSVADVGFLLTLLLLWLNDLGIEIYAVPGVCPIVIFASHFFPFLSFWLTITSAIILTLQPYIGHVNRFAAGKGHGKIVVICLAVFSLTVYLYKTWTNGVLEINGRKYCTVLQETRAAMKILNILDVLFLLFFPFLGFILFDLIVIFRHTGWVYKCQRKSGPLMRYSKDALRVVCAESIGFIVFVGPGCLSKFVFHVLSGPMDSETHIRDLLLQNLFQYLFYTYFAITPVLHISASLSFRNHIRVAMATHKTRTVSIRTEQIFQSERNSEQTLL